LEKAWPLFQKSDAKGVILRDVDKLKEVLACGLPTVVIGHQQTEVHGAVNVITDSAAIGRMGADHLLGCGFKHFAYCGYARTPSENAQWSEIRREHFTQRLIEAGYGAPRCSSWPWTRASGRHSRRRPSNSCERCRNPPA
jgi:LacI family transcriptional regulator